MAKNYKHLSLIERIEVYRMRTEGKSIQAVASALGRSPSTVSRELRRNSKPTKAWAGGYEPVRAQHLSERRRRWDGRFKLLRKPLLQDLVHTHLVSGWSPEQIAGHLKHQSGSAVISHESIYRFIYHRSAQKDHWHRLLPRHKSRRGRLGRRGGSPVQHIAHRVPIHDRPREIENRSIAGHWEADLMLFARYGQAVLVTHERHSRLLLATRQPNKSALPVANQLLRQFASLPASLRQSITFDNGTEFAMHHRLNDKLGMPTYFCDPHAPWQKGGIENAIGRMRRRLPRKTDLASLQPRQLDILINNYNHTPRKCLGFRTPAEVFLTKLQALHLKRECTFPFPRG